MLPSTSGHDMDVDATTLCSFILQNTEFEADNASKLRNLGIIAHVDAGKTTTSERMLYYSGESQFLGDVNKGDTVMDYLKIERQRGITINAATISFPWDGHLINLIDTPGHVDFTAEVERTVSVLDGSIVILDAVSGVQAQTETVWRQADRYQVPRLIFLNKMDREGAQLSYALNSLQSRFNIKALALQMTLETGKHFHSVIDLVHLQQIQWDSETLGRRMISSPLDDNDRTGILAIQARQELVEKVSEYDDELLEQLLVTPNASLDAITPHLLSQAIRRATLQRKIYPVLLGSSLKNIGVQLLLDAVIKYLPSPNDIDVVALSTEHSPSLSRKKMTSKKTPVSLEMKSNESSAIIPIECDKNQPLLGQAFKVVHDLRTNGVIVYFRLYRGTLRAGQRLWNVTRQCEERVLQLTRICADHFVDLRELTAGDIGAIHGLKKTRTSDTLVDLNGSWIQLPAIQMPEPVFFVSIMAASVHGEEKLKQVLNMIQLEDPSFHWSIHPDTQQWQMGCMGELHLDIIKDRLFNYFKVEAIIGEIQIAYKSTIKEDLFETFTKTYEFGSGMGHAHSEHVEIAMELEKLQDPAESSISSSTKTAIPSIFVIEEEALQELPLSSNKKQLKELIFLLEQAAQDAILSGVPAGYPLVQVRISIHKIKSHSTSSPNLNTYKIALMEAIFQLSRQAGINILEPIMHVEINLSNEYAGAVLSNLTSKKRAHIQKLEHGGEGKKNIMCFAPLSEIMNYSTQIRSLSKGTATLSFEFSHYSPLAQTMKQKILGTDQFD